MLLSPEALKASSQADPAIAEFLRANPTPQPDFSNHAAIRDFVASNEESHVSLLPPLPAHLTESLSSITLRDGFSSPIKIIRPTSPPPFGSPLVVLMFGGGWVAGTFHQLTAEARMVASLFSAVVVCTSYRLAPEHPFPVQTLDSYDNVKYLAENAKTLFSADLSKGFVIGGLSAGAGNAAAVAKMALDAKASGEWKAEGITGQWLGVPPLLGEGTVPEKYRGNWASREQNENAPILDGEALRALKKLVEWDEGSELKYPSLGEGGLKGLPRAYFQVDGMDPLRDDGLIFEEMLKEVGVETKMDFYPGCPHAHWKVMQGLEISERAEVDSIVGIGWLLGREVRRDEVLKVMKQRM